MYANTLDLKLIDIVAWRVLDSKSVYLAIRISTVAIECIGKYIKAKCNECIIDKHVLKNLYSYLDWLKSRLIIAKVRVTCPYLSKHLVC